MATIVTESGVQFDEDHGFNSERVGFFYFNADRFTVADGFSKKPITPRGFLQSITAYGGAGNEAYGTAVNLVVAGGTMIVPFMLPAPMLLRNYYLRSTDTASLRTAEANLYYLHDHGLTSSAIRESTNTKADFIFTPGGAASNQSSTVVSGAPYLLGPGAYLLAIRNTNPTGGNTFGIGTQASTMAHTKYLTKTNASALGSSMDMVASLTQGTAAAGVAIQGYLANRSAIF